MILTALIVIPLVMGLSTLGEKTGRSAWSTALLTALFQVALAFALLLRGSSALTLPLFGGQGITLEATSFGTLYVLLTALMWLVSVVASRHYFDADAPHLQRYYAALLITLSGTTGIFLAADLFTLFVFFEVMSFTSFLWVAHNQTADSRRAADSYLAFGVLGGLSILFGILLLYGLCPDLIIANLSTNFAQYVGSTQLTAACALLFVGFGAKAGAFFLHDWLPPSYLEAPAPATALLSGILSKAGVYGILLISVKILGNWEVFGYFLLIIALLSMVIGGLCALTSANLKRMLAFSSISQIGFILWGLAMMSLLGEHGAIAAYGTLLHMVNHTIIKVLLFVLAGIVFRAAGTLDLNQLRGFGKGKPRLETLFVWGMLAVAGIPGLSGYISKALLHESIVEYIALYDAPALFTVVEYLFLFAGGCTLAYMLKLYICLFREGDAPADTSCGDIPTILVLAPLAIALLTLGNPNVATTLGDYTADFFGVHSLASMEFFTLTNLKGSAISIAIGLVLFWLNRVVSKMGGGQQYSELADLEDTLEYRIYRPALTLLSFVGAFGARICDIALDLVVFVLARTAFSPLKIPDSFYYGDDHKLKVERARIHVTYSLAYSLLMFGMGFLFTIIMLLVLGAGG